MIDNPDARENKIFARADFFILIFLPLQGIGYLFYKNINASNLAGWFSVVIFSMTIFCLILSCWFVTSSLTISRKNTEKREPPWLVFLQLIRWYVTSFLVITYDLSFIFNVIRGGYL